MKILALEFSSPLRSVAVWNTDRVTGRAGDQGGRDFQPFALIESALRESGVSREEIDCVAVGLGPGSYAGIRSALAVAQGWQLARPVMLRGVSSADAVAHQHAGDGCVNVVLDAQRGEFFLARYEVKSGLARLLEPFRLMHESDWARREAGEIFLRPDVLESNERWLALPPDSAVLARLAAAQTGQLRGEELEPIYLRPAEFVKAPPARHID